MLTLSRLPRSTPLLKAHPWTETSRIYMKPWSSGVHSGHSTTKESSEYLFGRHFGPTAMSHTTRPHSTSSIVGILVAVPVINCALLIIGQSRIRQPDCLEGFIRMWRRVLVRMNFEGELAVRLLDLGCGCLLLQPQNAIVCTPSSLLRFQNILYHLYLVRSVCATISTRRAGTGCALAALRGCSPLLRSRRRGFIASRVLLHPLRLLQQRFHARQREQL